MEDSTMEATCASVDKKIDFFAGEELEHASEIAFALLKVANKDGDVTSPADASWIVSQPSFAFYWA